MDAVSDIKERLAIEDVVSEYVQLKRAGRNFKGLSPFGNEKTPSFMVSPEKQIWHDFSSGKGGNIFSFIMEVEGVDFKTALEMLARKAGVDLSQYKTGKSTDNQALKTRLFAALEAATYYYQKQLMQHTPALTYVRKKRAFTKETVLQFRLGYSPASGRSMLEHLVAKGFTVNELKKAGLVTDRYGSPADMFRDRLMVPLSDDQGRVVGFTARLLTDVDGAPKYINTPTTLLYDKGRQAYGFHFAKDAMRKKGYAVVVEGNLDVIASHQADVNNVVATAGTAMTVHHLKLLKRFTSDIRLCFDQDNAGQNAAERAIDLANSAGVTLQMITITDAKDPDDLIRKNPEKWLAAIEKPQYVVDWLMDRYSAKLDITTAVGKREYSDIVAKLIARLPDEVERDHYITKLASKIAINAEALQRKINAKPKDVTQYKRIKKAETPKNDTSKETTVKIQHLLAIALHVPHARQELAKLPKDLFLEDESREVRDFLIKHEVFDTASAKVIFEELRNIADYVKMLILLFEELYQSTDAHELAHQTEQLIARLVHEYVKNKKNVYIQKLEQDADTKDVQHILAEVKKLDELARLYKK